MHPRATFTAVLAIALIAPRVAAQAPVITPRGDPSVEDDTIYRLAVDSAKYPDQSTYRLLDDGVIRYEADGRSTVTYRQAHQILREDGVKAFQEHSFAYEPGHQKLTINWIRVVRPDGTVISSKPSQRQETDVPAAMGDPVYSDRHVIRVSLSGVAVGTIVDISYTLEELAPFRTGDAFGSWYVNDGPGVARSRLLIDVPDSVHLTITERNLHFPRRTTHAHGRTVYLWATQDVPTVKSEAFAADSDTVITRIRYALPSTWGQIGQWYANLVRDRYTVTRTVAHTVDSLVAAASTRDDSIRAVEQWVAGKIRYVSIDLGIGGYRPRMPDSVIATGFGDCKDKATLFVTALAHLGITAYPVLLDATAGVVDPALPSIAQFNHEIAAVKTAARYTYTDLTDEFRPYGTLPFSEQGGFGVVVHPDGSTEEVTLPEDSADVNLADTRIVGTLDSSGTFDGRLEEIVNGIGAAWFRKAFAEPLDSARGAKVAQALASNVFDGAEGDSLQVSVADDPTVPSTLVVHVHHWRAAIRAGEGYVLTIPFKSMARFTTGATELEQSLPRLFPLDAAKVVGPEVEQSTLTMTLPPGLHAKLPPDVTADSPFGRYTMAYTQDGRALRIARTMRGNRGVLPPDRVKDLIDWFETIGRDNTQVIVLEPVDSAKNR